MLPVWNQRSEIVAGLTNPAFCGRIIHAFVKGYNIKGNKGCPFSLCYFILPMILNPKIRSTIPKMSTTTLHTWFEKASEVKIGLADKINDCLAITKECIMFAMANDVLIIDKLGTIHARNGVKLSFKSDEDKTEVEECFKKAEVLGKMFSGSGNEFTIYSIIGVKP